MSILKDKELINSALGSLGLELENDVRELLASDLESKSLEIIQVNYIKIKLFN